MRVQGSGCRARGLGIKESGRKNNGTKRGEYNIFSGLGVRAYGCFVVHEVKWGSK